MCTGKNHKSAGFSVELLTNVHSFLFSSLTQDFARKAVVTAIFCVAFLVLPKLFRINKLPRWTSVVLLYPIYNLSVDSSGKASSLAPSTLLGLAVLMIQVTRTIGPAVSAISRISLWRTARWDDSFQMTSRSSRAGQ